ncbi:MAG: tRNA preQ1(34) S-adenosylmethionine ribosyltransferase-isomerase QueA [Patescibacteria group bacterium]
MVLEDVEKFDYDLPEELIRKKGIEPRDSARLFVYNTKTDTITFDTFRNLAKYLPKESLLVLNETKVLPARLWLKKETGGKIEVFVLTNQLEDGENISVLVDRKTLPGQKLFFPNGDFFDVVSQDENVFFVKVQSKENLSLFELLEQYGTTPLPHYLEGEETPESELRKRYQTVFAKEGTSVAAPTASLHFTEPVFALLREKGIETASLTLNVGLGTFAPLQEKNFTIGKLHKEQVIISEETATKIQLAKIENRSIVAVGTTVTRTLESLAQKGALQAFTGTTDIFLFPPYQFQVVDCLITNFHLPKSSLMLLVEAFLQDKGAKQDIVSLYERAKTEGFSFYSFGDSMLIL